MTPSDVLFSYPPNARVNRIVPKSKIYAHSGASTKLKDLFVQEVEQITWLYKLASETIHVPAAPSVPELQVFEIKVKTAKVSHDVLHSIDGAIPFPMIFELTCEERTQVVAAYKRPNAAGGDRWVTSTYFSSAWLPASTPRVSLPVALDLAGLYAQMVRRLLPMTARSQESLTRQLERIGQAEAKQREVDKTAARMAKEKQFNRRVELNAALRRLQEELSQLR